MSEKIPKHKIEQIIEEKVQERVKEELEKRNLDRKNTEVRENSKEDGSVSRRKFLKTITAGTLGAAGLAMTSNAAALDLSENTVSTTGTQITMENGDVEIPNGNLNFPNSNNIQDSGTNAISFDGNQNVTIPNGNLELSQNLTTDDGAHSITFANDININSNNDINLNDGNNDTLLTINQGGPVEIAEETNLRLDTGQDIEDGGGTRRIRLSSYGTAIFTPDDLVGFQPNENNIEINAHSDRPVRIFDREGIFTALEYKTNDERPGTLELSNAKLQLYTTSSDPDASQGEMWYRSDLD